MDTKVPRGKTKRIEGSLTEALGKLTGDKTAEDKGSARKLEGEAEEAAGTREPPKT